MKLPGRLATPRLVLRRWRPEDRDAFAAVWEDEDVWGSLRPGAPFDPAVAGERFEHHLRHWERHGFGIWAAQVGAEVAGWAGPAHPDFIPDLADRVEIGWTLRRPFWGRGLATEAARAAVDATLAGLEIETVISLIHPANARSAAVAARLGMRRAGRVRHPELGQDLAVHVLEAERARRPG